MEKVIRGYKAFDENMKCLGFQYKEGIEHKTSKAIRCKEGFHFCENPLDIFCYYSPISQFREVKGSGKFDKDPYDTKIACTKIKIGAKISLHSLIDASVKFIFSKVDWKKSKKSNTGNQSAATNTGNQSAATNTGYQSAATNTGYQSAATNTGNQSAATNTGNRSAATNTGDRSAATNTGYQSAATNTGDRSAATNTGNQSAATNTGYQSAATVEGKESIACGLGVGNKAKGKKGCWLVLAEWGQSKDYEWHIKCVKSIKVDGKLIKEDTWYELKGKKFVVVK